MNKTFNVLAVIALVVTIIGALNWLLVGIFGFNLVTWATMGVAWLARAIYILVGISGVFMLVWLFFTRGNMVDDRRDYKYDQRKSY